LSSFILSIGSIYLFIIIGYIYKFSFKDGVSEKSFVLLTVYFLTPMLTFWGLTKKSFDTEFLFVPILYFIITVLSIFVSYFLAKIFFDEPKEKSIITVASAIGNTGNLGIPLGVALFGEESLIYTSIINVANIFIVYSFGAYFYSRGSFSIKESIINLLKLPVIWVAIVAIIFNLNQIVIPIEIDRALEMGAYTSMVIQLVIFGIYLYNLSFKTFSKKLLFSTLLIKFFLIPLIGLMILNSLNLSQIVVTIIMLELIVPLAITNINLASLYDCKPNEVTSLVFVTTIIFIPYIYLFLTYFKSYF